MPVLVAVLAAGSTVACVVAFATRIDSNVASMFVARQHRGLLGAAARIGDHLLSWSLVRRVARVDRLAATIDAAGKQLDLGDVMVMKCAGAATAVMIVAVLVPALIPLAALIGAGAFVLPDMVLARSAARRRRAADLEVTQFLDLLAAASSAGLSAPAAIRRASTGVRGPLAEELERASASVDVGARWREELAGIASRLGLRDLRAAVVVIARTEMLGSSLAESLRDLAADVRGSRRARSAERARTAPVKMLFPLVFMVLPAFLLLTVVPVLIATIRSLS
jgi:Flp pilus assembly protein TadB